MKSDPQQLVRGQLNKSEKDLITVEHEFSFNEPVYESICFMMNQKEIEKKLKNLKPILSDRFAVERIGYFGSFSRNEQTEKSDIDILVEFRKPLGWDFFDLQEFLENELKIKVDLVSSRALKDQLKDSILKQVQYI